MFAALASTAIVKTKHTIATGQRRHDQNEGLPMISPRIIRTLLGGVTLEKRVPPEKVTNEIAAKGGMFDV